MIKKILIALLIFMILLVVFKDAFIKKTVMVIGSKVVGTKLEMEKFSSDLFGEKISIEGLKIYNPEGFPEEPLLFIEKVEVQYDFQSIINGKVYCPLVLLDLRELVVINNKEDVLNVDELPIIKKQEEAAEESESDEVSGDEEMNFQIDVLKLNVRKVVFKDYTKGKGDDPKIEAFDVGLKDKEYENITSPDQLVGSVVVAAMKGTAIKGAKVYAMASLATIAGVGFLPAGVATALVGKDHSIEEFNYGYDEVMTATISLFQEEGKIDNIDKDKGAVRGNLEGCEVAVKLEGITETQTKVTVSARKLLLPKPKIAGGVIHQISLRLEQEVNH